MRKSPAHDVPLVVRGAVSAVRTCFPIPLSIRACGFPAHGLPMIFWTWLRRLWVADGATKPVQAVPVEPLCGPLIGLSSTQVAAPLFDHQAEQPPHHIPVDLGELIGGVAGAKVVTPPAQDWIQVRDHITDIQADAVTAGAVTDLGPPRRARPVPHCGTTPHRHRRSAPAPPPDGGTARCRARAGKCWPTAARSPHPAVCPRPSALAHLRPSPLLAATIAAV